MIEAAIERSLMNSIVAYSDNTNSIVVFGADSQPSEPLQRFMTRHHVMWCADDLEDAYRLAGWEAQDLYLVHTISDRVTTYIRSRLCTWTPDQVCCIHQYQ